MRPIARGGEGGGMKNLHSVQNRLLFMNNGDIGISNIIFKHFNHSVLIARNVHKPSEEPAN